jgi:hypothetical protein
MIVRWSRATQIAQYLGSRPHVSCRLFALYCGEAARVDHDNRNCEGRRRYTTRMGDGNTKITPSSHARRPIWDLLPSPLLPYRRINLPTRRLPNSPPFRPSWAATFNPFLLCPFTRRGNDEQATWLIMESGSFLYIRECGRTGRRVLFLERP